MKRFASALASVAFAAVLAQAAAHAQVGPGAPDAATVRGWLAERLANRPNAGIVVGIYAGGRGRVIAVGSGGPNVQPLSGDTVFEIGSITKVFTAAILADMVARGELKLEDPVQRLLPADVRMPARGGAEIRLVDLATQTSGLPRLPLNLSPADGNNPYADYTASLMYQFLSSYQLPRDIGERYEYSNFGFGLLGHVLSLKAAVPYGTLVVDRILRPLQMADTTIDLTPALRPRAAVGYRLAGNATPYWTFAALAGCGALRSTVNDLLKFLAANLAPPSDRLRTALQSMHQARHSVGTPSGEIGLAWHIRHAYDETFVWHNGGTFGFHSFIGLNHRTGVGVVVLHNSADTIDDIGFHLLDARFPLRAAAASRE